MKKEKNTAHTILDTARLLLQTKGAGHLTMREIAKGSGVALGTIYNYYATKDDIVLALVEEFWSSALKGLGEITQGESSFTSEIQAMYIFLLQEFSKFQSDWVELLRGISEPRKKESFYTEQAVQQQMCRTIGNRLQYYYPSPWQTMEKAEFASFICDSFLFSLIHQRKDIDTLLQVIQAVVEKQTTEKKGTLL